MARLSAGRERLPYELRQPHSWPGLRGLWSPLPAVHCAMQYLLVSADLAVLNSAFGHPLTLAGTWEWFDGTLFMHMQDVVERQQASVFSLCVVESTASAWLHLPSQFHVQFADL